MRSIRMETYYKRKEQGLCVSCGDKAESGRTKCKICANIDRIRMKKYRDNLTPEQKSHKKEYYKMWAESHPERMEEYKKRRPEYNRRYKEGSV